MIFADYCRNDERWRQLREAESEAERAWRNPAEPGPCTGEVGAELMHTGYYVAYQEAQAERVTYQARLRFKWRSSIGCICCVPGGTCIHDSMAKGPE